MRGERPCGIIAQLPDSHALGDNMDCLRLYCCHVQQADSLMELFNHASASTAYEAVPGRERKRYPAVKPPRRLLSYLCLAST